MRLGRNILYWIAASLVAIVLLESNAMLGLAFASVAGVALGILLFVK